MLIDSGSTHNFINWCNAEELQCFIHLVNDFQVLITNGILMKCEGQCENVKLQYNLKTHMFAVNIGGCDIVLGVE